MTVHDALSSGIERTDAEILLAFALDRDRTWILAHPEHSLSPAEEATVKKFIDRRRAGEPVAYITGMKDFYGRSFIVNRHALIPRPATEALIDIAKDLFTRKKVQPVREIDSRIVAWTHVWGPLDDVRTIVDIGTGSGCIAVTLACELPQIKIIATDVSGDALSVARENAKKHAVTNRILFLQGRGLDPVADIDEPFLIVSNPPYIPKDVALSKDVADYEPHEALFAGERGADVIERIVRESQKNPYCRGFLMECREEQARTDLA